MPTRVAVVEEPVQWAARRLPGLADADVLLDWRTERANAHADWDAIGPALGRDLPARCLDLLDIATAVYLSDLAVQRGAREGWTRNIELSVPVREVGFWTQADGQLRSLLYALTRDNWSLSFYQALAPSPPSPGQPSAGQDFQPDCISLLSGGVDSLAGAVMLQSAGRRPLYVSHRSGNPTIERAQQKVKELVGSRWPGQSAVATVTIAPRTGGEAALPFPPPEQRENSRRARSLLYMAVAVAAAVAHQVEEVYLCENGVLTVGLPMASARAGSMSTRSTHPVPVAMLNELCEAAGLRALVVNPFIYQTKGDLVRDLLKPALPAAEIQATISCWAAGRRPRQCGGCIPCLLRRMAMLYAGLHDEAYMLDVAAEPARYVGTDAYGNLVDLLRHARQMLDHSDAEVLMAHPDLLELQTVDVDIPDVIAMLRRHGEQVCGVVQERFPRAAALIAG